MSVTSRILVGFLVFLAVGLYSLQSRLLKRVERQYLEAAEELMVDAAQIFASLLEQQLGESGELDLSTIRRAFVAASGRKFTAQIYNLTKTSMTTHIYVTDRNGIVLFDSNSGAAEGQDYARYRDVSLTLAGRYGARSTHTDPDDEDSSVMFVAAPIRRADEIIGVVSVSKPQRSLFTFRDETQVWIRNLSWSFFFALAAGAYLIVALFSRPIRRLTTYVRAVARGERVPPPRLDSPEVATLGRAFEEMRDAFEDRKYVESYVQSLTHEMKSPVAAIRGASELLREEMPARQRERFLDNIQAESRRLQNIIDRLLALSALEARKALEKPAPVSIAALAEEICLQMQPVAEARGVKMQCQANGSPIVLGERFLLEIALTNLLQNAADFSHPGTVIRILASTQDGKAELVVEDEGVGIPEYALPRLFERFYSLQRLSTGRKGSGLGLCFVREVVELHGGQVTIANRSQGSGTRATITLPLATARD